MSQHDIREQEIERQFIALGQPAEVRITAKHATEDRAQNLCKNKEGIETFWSLQDVLSNAPKLARLNAQNWNIFTTPIESENIYLLVDDIRPTLAEAGFTPNLLQRSSPNSQQAIFVLPFTHDRQIYLDAFNRLNKEHGDPQISGLRHPFRLAGFTNRKPKYQATNGHFPFVQIETTRPIGYVCPVMLSFIETLAAQRQGTLPPVTTPAQAPGMRLPKTPARLEDDAEKHEAAMGRDFYLARNLIHKGFSGTALSQEFEENSEHIQAIMAGLAGYDLDKNRYVERTLKNAAEAVEKAKKNRPTVPPPPHVVKFRGGMICGIGKRPQASPSSSPKP